jgi:hypothetical protein
MKINKVIIMAIIVFTILIVFGQAYMLTRGNYVQIIVPNYNTTPDTYITTTYVEKNGCIEFKDGLGVDRKVCGTYQISKY